MTTRWASIQKRWKRSVHAEYELEMQPYIRNRVDSEAAHSEAVDYKTKVNVFTKWRAFYVVLLCHAWTADSPTRCMGRTLLKTLLYPQGH